MSNFLFLEKEWPLLSRIGKAAENYLYNDPNACLYKLGVLSEQIISYMCDANGIVVTENDNTQAGKIRLLRIKRLLPKDIDDILYGLRTTRNKAVHDNFNCLDKAILMLELAQKLCIWFSDTYSENSEAPLSFVLPEQAPNYLDIIKSQESQIEELKKNLAIIPLKINMSIEQRRKKSERNANLMTLSEREIRFFIDEQLRKAGWKADTANLRYNKGTRPQKGKNIAIAEWPTNSSYVSGGYADYALFIGEKLVGVIETKKPSEDVASAIDIQAKDYAKNIKTEHCNYIIGNWGEYQVPFLFTANGRPYMEQLSTKSGIWFLDVRKINNISYPLRNWFSPENLLEKIAQDEEKSNAILETINDSFLTDKQGLNLRDYQVKAVEKTAEAIIEGQREILLAMATGTGKTRTVLGIIYKMLEAKRFKRILFLVDRVSLGEQAMDTFKDVKLKELLTLDEIYEVKAIDDSEINLETKVSVSTVQGLVRRVIVNEEPDLMPGTFDLIIVDEAHRGYILDREMSEEEILYEDQDDYMSKYKQVIQYFDAVKIGLTATPALHTMEIFGAPIFTYSYREAVIDGWLVDHEPPYIINTDFNTNNVKFANGEQLAIYDPNTNELLNSEELHDELEFDISDFNRNIVLPDHTKKVLYDLSKDIDPEGKEKTLIFAVNDAHADQIVSTLREIYEPFGVSNEAIVKITGKAAGGNKTKMLKVIKQFKNNQYPNIAVTVDLLTTGIDVPSICNIVFMRKINSRILFEQMLGRATRLCPEIGKTHFTIYDPAKVYRDIGPVSTMKSVLVKNTMLDLVEDLSRPSDKSKKTTIDKIIVKLQRKKQCLTDDQKQEIEDRIGQSLGDYIKSIKDLPEQQQIEKCIDELDFLVYIEKFKNKKRGFFYSEKEDILFDRTRGYGDAERPEDYIEAFNAFVKDNQDKIEAIKIACTKPSDLTREELKKLRLALNEHNYTERNLNQATSEIKNEEIVADIISYVRQAVLKTPVRNREDRVNDAFAKLKANHQEFNRIQLDLLEKIKTYMTHESILNIETFENNQFRDMGGFNRLNMKFAGKLTGIIKEINTYLYEERGVA